MESRPLETKTLNLYKGDFEKLQAVAPSQGASLIVRNLIAAFLEKIEAGMTPTAKALEGLKDEALAPSILREAEEAIAGDAG